MKLRPYRWLALFVCFSCVSARSDLVDQAGRRLHALVKAELPAGWVATFDEHHDWLQIVREKPVQGVSVLPNPSAVDGAGPHEFWFAFRLIPSVSPADYRRLKNENETTRKKVSAAHGELMKRGLDHKFDRFIPVTEADKAAVAAYEALKKSLHVLPDFYFDDVSLHHSPPAVRVLEEKTEAECEKAEAVVRKHLLAYAP